MNIVEPGRTQMTNGSRSLFAGYLRIQTHIHNIQYSLLFHCKNDCTNAPQYYVIRSLPLLFTYANNPKCKMLEFVFVVSLAEQKE